MPELIDNNKEPFAFVGFEGQSYGRVYFLPDDKLNIANRIIADGNKTELIKLVVKLNKIWSEYH